MKTSEIINGLEDLIQDRKSFVTPANDKFYGKDNPFKYDIAVLKAAIDKLNRRTEPENKPLEQLKSENANLQEALKLMAQDFYDSSDDEIHTGADSLADDYIQMAQAGSKPENKPQQLCNENENFIQTKFGYCFYTLDYQPLIYNLYVYPQYRRRGYSRILLELVIGEIRKRDKRKIYIQAAPRENSIGLEDLTKFYKSMGLIVEYPQAGRE